ncbi:MULTISPECIES: DUF4147 domain-containing protein [unclassified Roseitalea]|uniref:glycerate kinase type-2 family protein n=1 Tax=unclassified Roseitalea TaxID=2639107 RepID=UPI00273D75ED|nr:MULTISPECIES: DUF4147 domain-containing protein [unclassified Roseitalea]
MTDPNTVAAMRADARAIFSAGIAAADPYDATRHALLEHKSAIDAARRVFLLAGGKASLAMMRAALAIVPGDRVTRAVAVTNPENAGSRDGLARVDIHVGGHPLPDAGGAAGAAAIEAAASQAAAGDLVICLISGGASALMPAPVAGVSLDDKIAATGALLRSGADICEVNTVRTALSRLKGGGLARAASPARVLGLILSDVPGDDPATIASGPTVPRDIDPRQALDVIDRYDLAVSMPASVMDHLRAAPPRAAAPEEGIENRVIGSNAISLAACEERARALGYDTVIAARWLDGDVAEAAELLIGTTIEAAAGHARRLAVLAGGETTVRVVGHGKGGRNQELALRFALAAGEMVPGGPWVMLSGGTDGRDGPTDAAGGLVDPGTVSRMTDAGMAPADRLADNDAYRALKASGDLLMTGPTGTNVADLQIVLMAPDRVSADT